VSFRNLTIEKDGSGNNINAFISIYTPDKKWIDNFRKGHPFGWSVKTEMARINLSDYNPTSLKQDATSTNPNNPITNTVSIVCEDITYFYTVPVACSDGQMPWDCHWFQNDITPTGPGQFNASYTVGSFTVSYCRSVDDGNASGGGGGGGNTNPNPPGGYDPCDSGGGPIGVESINGMKVFVTPPTPCDPTTPGDQYPIPPSNPLTAKEFLIQLLSITDQYVINKIEQTINPNTTVTIVDKLANYYYNNGGYSSENIDFLNWASNYVTYTPNVVFEEFKNEYLVNQPSINDVILPALIDTTGLSAYARFKEIVTNLPSFLIAYPNVKKALAFYTGFTEAEVMSKMQPGKGPKIILVSNFPSTKYGHYNALNKTLELNLNYINGLEAAQLPKTIQATALLLAITTFHEFVHYGRNFNKLTYDFINPNNGVSTEAGWTFEQNIDPSGLGINKYRAIKWLEFYNFYFNL
jgi:hypothetical protein